MDENIFNHIVNDLQRMDSNSSHLPLMTSEKKRKCWNFHGLTIVESSLIFLNVSLFVILLPLGITWIYWLNNIKDSVDVKLSNHTNFISLIDDVLNLTQEIQIKVGGINHHQNLMQGTYLSAIKGF